MDTEFKDRFSIGDYLRFIIPSIIGILLFMFPFKHEGETTIAVAFFASLLSDLIKDQIPLIVTTIISITAIGSIIYKVFKPSFIKDNKTLKGIFDVNMFWLITRIVGMAFAIIVFFNVGPKWITSEDIGGLILYDLLITLFTIFLFAGFLLPFLTDFGLLEFVGTLVTKFMRPIFLLPGRSSIDCIASWVGDGTIGVTLTNKQYEEGYYTQREASVVATTFSAVSITFSLVVLSQVGLGHLFGHYYLTVIIIGIVAGIVVPRIPPLSKKPDSYYGGVEEKSTEEIPEGYTPVSWGTNLALIKAKESGDVKQFIKNGMATVLDMWLGVMPVIMAFGTVALIIAETTPIFQWLGVPFIPLLKLFKIPYAVEASQTMIIGFADMFLPSVIGASIPSDLTRFVIAGVSVSQLIYLSEVGAVILGSKIPVSLGEMFIIFIERTLIALPIMAIAGHILF